MPLALRSVLAGLISIGLFAVEARAGEIHKFDPDLFARAQQVGKRVMVVVGSRWDPDGMAAYGAMENISRDMLYPDVEFFRVDFNGMKDVLRNLRVYEDSTVIVYRGTQERGRVSGDIDEDGMRRLLDNAR